MFDEIIIIKNDVEFLWSRNKFEYSMRENGHLVPYFLFWVLLRHDTCIGFYIALFFLKNGPTIALVFDNNVSAYLSTQFAYPVLATHCEPSLLSQLVCRRNLWTLRLMGFDHLLLTGNLFRIPVSSAALCGGVFGRWCLGSKPLVGWGVGGQSH